MIQINEYKYYSSKEVADIFQVHISTVARWRTNKWLESCKINERKYIYREDHIEKFLQRGI